MKFGYGRKTLPHMAPATRGEEKQMRQEGERNRLRSLPSPARQTGRSSLSLSRSSLTLWSHVTILVLGAGLARMAQLK